MLGEAHANVFSRLHPAQSPTQPGYVSRFFAGAAAVAADVAAGVAAAYVPGITKKQAKKILKEVCFRFASAPCSASRPALALAALR